VETKNAAEELPLERGALSYETEYSRFSEFVNAKGQLWQISVEISPWLAYQVWFSAVEVPRLGRITPNAMGCEVGRVSENRLVEVRELRKSYLRSAGALAGDNARDGGAGRFTAVDGVSFSVSAGETFAIVGESGCGKTTLARMLLRLIEPDSGEIRFGGENLLVLGGEKLRVRRREMQMIFQDPFASLNPRMRVGEIVAEPLAIHEPKLSRSERQEQSAAMLQRVGLNEGAMKRYPHEFSGGQRQRIGIARALILRPKLVVADEPVSALDVSVGAQVLLLLQELQGEFGLTYLLISHSLPVVAQVATRVAVMRAGKFVEMGDVERVLRQPEHAYTRELLAAVPELPEA
jgi:oligopeptide transport system ATP-binding protein